VRQFFPETWVWSDLTTDASGKANQQLTVPDSITTWMLNAVAISPTVGLGSAEAQLQVLQPFFIQLDLVYSAIRGEQFPVKVSLYNYEAKSEDFKVDLEQADWFDLADQSSKSVTVNSNDINGVTFNIKPKGLGTHQLKVTARSQTRADAIVKDFLVEPEGVQREQTDNLVLEASKSYSVDMSTPVAIIDGSARGLIALTGSYMAQTIEGLDHLLQMPYGCGEQNMILFAPDVAVAQYLKDTNQTKPEIMAKAESLMLTGYQRELTYRRTDSSFSAFGNSDQQGSLWLSAFVLKTFAQAQNLIYIDPTVLTATAAWITSQQKSDGSFEPVGFMHHQDLLGGLHGNTALTAYVMTALLATNEQTASAKAKTYLEGALASVDFSNDSYGLAVTAYALELAKSSQRDVVYNKLVKAAKKDANGLYWGDLVQPQDQPTKTNGAEKSSIYPQPNHNPTIALLSKQLAMRC
jgi:CD109 antigen